MFKGADQQLTMLQRILHDEPAMSERSGSKVGRATGGEPEMFMFGSGFVWSV